MHSNLKSKVYDLIINTTALSIFFILLFIFLFSSYILFSSFNLINQRCSRCKKTYYCSAEHQKGHWQLHKGVCIASTLKIEPKLTVPSTDSNSSTDSNKNSSSSSNNNSSSSSSGNNNKSSKLNDQKDASSDQNQGNEKEKTASDEQEKKTVRCMFCGDQLILASEEEAVDHMRVCVALQEQLESKDQFTIPKKIREEKKI